MAMTGKGPKPHLDYPMEFAYFVKEITKRENAKKKGYRLRANQVSSCLNIFFDILFETLHVNSDGQGTVYSADGLLSGPWGMHVRYGPALQFVITQIYTRRDFPPLPKTAFLKKALQNQTSSPALKPKRGMIKPKSTRGR